MTCDEAELKISCGDDEAELTEHLASCERCTHFAQSTRAVLSDAALPPLTAGERAALSPLARATHAAWQSQQQRRLSLRRVTGLAMAACFGAAVASAALLPRTHVAQQAAPESGTPEWALTDLNQADAVSAADDELEFEVSWPTAEGDVP